MKQLQKKEKDFQANRQYMNQEKEFQEKIINQNLKIGREKYDMK